MRNFPCSKSLFPLAAGAFFLAIGTIFAQQLAAPPATDGTTAKLVCDLVSQQHVSKAPIDDSISEKLVDRYIKTLDPTKLYFLKSDINELYKYRTQLDDLLKVGNVEFAHKAFEIYQSRMEQLMGQIHQLIDADHDFTVDESIVIDSDIRDWARDESELSERWRKRIKSDLLNLMLDDTKLDEAREQLHKRYRSIARVNRQTDDSEILEMYLTAMTNCFDPHSSYMSPQTLEDFRISMELSLDGIGAALRSEDGVTTVAQIVPNGAAAKDGRLEVGDKIVGVGQADSEIIDIVEMKLNNVVRLIRGRRGTIVQLKVKKGASSEVVVYKLTRQKIELNESAVQGKVIDLSERLGGPSLKIGVINIPSFYHDFRGEQQGKENFKSTARDVLEVLQEFQQAGGIEAIIVDLRTNGGGALSEAIEVSGLFIDEGPVVQVKDQNGDVDYHSDDIPGVAYSGPLIVLCNRLSASASEIFAGVIKDYRRGIIVGDQTTHGKGTVQNVIPVRRSSFPFFNPQDRGALKLTVNQFYRVNGESTQSLGVKSDVVLPSILDYMDLGESFLDNALPHSTVDPAPYQPAGRISESTIKAVQTASDKRVAENKEFQELKQEVERYVARKNQKTLSLNEATRRKELERDKSTDRELLEKAVPDEDQDKSDEIFKKNFYNDEVLRIANDYVNQVKNQTTVQNSRR